MDPGITPAKAWEELQPRVRAESGNKYGESDAKEVRNRQERAQAEG
jgi:hypothetical protein